MNNSSSIMDLHLLTCNNNSMDHLPHI
jgi:hypothetical protein